MAWLTFKRAVAPLSLWHANHVATAPSQSTNSALLQEVPLDPTSTLSAPM